MWALSNHDLTWYVHIMMFFCKVKKNRSQSLWQIGKPDSKCVFIFSLGSSIKFELVNLVCPVWNMDFWMNKIQDYNKSEHRVQEVCCPMCFIVSVTSFHDILTGKFIKAEKKSKKNVCILKFCGMKHSPQRNVYSSFET